MYIHCVYMWFISNFPPARLWELVCTMCRVRICVLCLWSSFDHWLSADHTLHLTSCAVFSQTTLGIILTMSWTSQILMTRYMYVHAFTPHHLLAKFMCFCVCRSLSELGILTSWITIPRTFHHYVILYMTLQLPCRCVHNLLGYMMYGCLFYVYVHLSVIQRESEVRDWCWQTWHTAGSSGEWEKMDSVSVIVIPNSFRFFRLLVLACIVKSLTASWLMSYSVVFR